MSRIIMYVAIMTMIMVRVDGFLPLHSTARQHDNIICSSHLAASTSGSSFGPSKKSNPKSKKYHNKKDKNNNKDGSNNLFGDSDTRQLLGLKTDPSMIQNEEKWKIRLQLMKPISWVPLSMIVMAGAAASGNYHWIWNPWNENDRNVMMGVMDAIKGCAAVVLAGPFSEGFAQTINDWYDRDIDAINVPYRPIPSGRITPKEVMDQLRFLFVGGMILAFGLDYSSSILTTTITTSTSNTNIDYFPTISAISIFGYFMSYIYSAPPLKLKQNGWLGDIAIGLCYITLPWLCGLSVFGSIEKPVDWMLALGYSLTSLSAGIVNDFKSMEGDLEFGLQSVPILIGLENAKWVASLVPDLVQFAIAAYLYSIGEYATAAFLSAMVLPQIYLQWSLLFQGDPFENDMKYIGLTQPFVMFGLLATAMSMGQHDWSTIP